MFKLISQSYFRAKKHTDHKLQYAGNRWTIPLAAFFMKFARTDIHSLTAFLRIFTSIIKRLI